MKRKFVTIVMYSLPSYLLSGKDGTFAHTLGKPILVEKDSSLSGYHVDVKYDLEHNPYSIWKGREGSTLYISGKHAEEVEEEHIALTGSRGVVMITDGLDRMVRATSRDNPFRHWNRIKGNRKVGLPEVFTMKELRA